MGEATRYFEDVKEGDEAPASSHTLTRTDLVRYAGASGDYNPMHHDEVLPPRLDSPVCSVTGCSPWACSARPSPTTSVPATSRTTRCASRARPGRGRAHHEDRGDRHAGRRRPQLGGARLQPGPTGDGEVKVRRRGDGGAPEQGLTPRPVRARTRRRRSGPPDVVVQADRAGRLGRTLCAPAPCVSQPWVSRLPKLLHPRDGAEQLLRVSSPEASRFLPSAV